MASGVSRMFYAKQACWYVCHCVESNSPSCLVSNIRKTNGPCAGSCLGMNKIDYYKPVLNAGVDALAGLKRGHYAGVDWRDPDPPS